MFFYFFLSLSAGLAFPLLGTMALLMERPEHKALCVYFLLPLLGLLYWQMVSQQASGNAFAGGYIAGNMLSLVALGITLRRSQSSWKLR